MRHLNKCEKSLEELIPTNQNSPFNMHDLINGIIDEGSFFEIKKLFAAELITGLAAWTESQLDHCKSASRKRRRTVP